MSPQRIFALGFSLLLLGSEILQIGASIQQSNIAQAYEKLETGHVASTLLLSSENLEPAELKSKLRQLKQDYEIESVEVLTSDNSSIEIAFSEQEDIALIMATFSSNITLEPDYILSATAVPSDTHYHEQWYLNNTGQTYHTSATTTTSGTADIDINWQDTYEYSSLRGQGVVVAIIDSGLNTTHTELSNNLWTNTAEQNNNTDDDNNNLIDDIHGWNFISNNDDLSDALGHGTQAAGIVAATANGAGIIGIASQAQIMPLKVLDQNGNGSTSNVIKAVNYAVAKGANIINMSFGGPGADTLAMRNVCNNAVSNGTLIVAAAGNGNVDITTHHFAPASISSVMAVGSIANNGTKASFSNTGNALSLVTPGARILTTRSGGTEENSNQVLADNSNKYIISSGTSFSSPMVAAAAALVIQQNPNLTVAQVRTRLQQTARDLGTEGKDTQFGYGLLDISAALSISPPPPNLAPEIVSATWTQNPVVENATTILSISAQDPENDTLTVTANMGSLGLSNQTLSLNNNLYVSTAIQPQLGVGEFTVPIAVSDGTSTSTGSVLLTVTAIPATLAITQPSTANIFTTTDSSLTLSGTVSGTVQSITINNEPLSTFSLGETTWSKTVSLPETTNVFNVNALDADNELMVADSIIITKATESVSEDEEDDEERERERERRRRRREREREQEEESAAAIVLQTMPPNFLDIGSDHFAFSQINDLAQKGAVNNQASYYYPNRAISRGEFLKIAMYDSNLMNDTCMQVPASFNDTNNSVFNSVINCAIVQKVVAPSQAAFLPYQPVSREQAIVWLVAVRRSVLTNTATTFPDITNQITVPYIETARIKQWISGSNGLFYPRNSLSRAEAAKVIVNSRH